MQEDGYFDDIHRQLCLWTQKHVERGEKEVEETGECFLELAYTMPRGSLKSTIVTKHLSAWLVVRRFYKFRDSSTRLLVACNTFNNASSKMFGDIGGLYKSHSLFRALFPEILPRLGKDGNSWSKVGLEINREGSFAENTYECAGVNTRLVSRHYNCIIEDDTTAPDVSDMEEGLTRPSMNTLKQAIGFHQMLTGLFVPKSFILHAVVSTRWAEQDLISHVQGRGKFNYFDVPAMNKSGEPNFRSFYTINKLNKIKNRIGDYMFSMQYLNRPLPDEMRVFNPAHFQYIDEKYVPHRGYITIACDPAISKKEESCESSITVNQHMRKGYENHEYWWEDCNGKFLPFELANRILDIAERHQKERSPVPVRAIIIETNAWQLALKSILENEMEKRNCLFPIIPHQSRTNKNIRIESLQPRFQSGRIHFVQTKDNLLGNQTESQLLQYPNGLLVDTLDSWAMHQKYIPSDNKRDNQYTKEIEAEKAEQDPNYAAYLEIRNRRKREKVAILSEPNIYWNQGLTENSYGRR